MNRLNCECGSGKKNYVVGQCLRAVAGEVERGEGKGGKTNG